MGFSPSTKSVLTNETLFALANIEYPVAIEDKNSDTLALDGEIPQRIIKMINGSFELGVHVPADPSEYPQPWTKRLQVTR